MRVPARQLLPGPCRPHGRFDDRRVLKLTSSVRRGNILRPLLTQQVGGDSCCRLVTKRQQLQTSVLTGLRAIPYVILSYSCRSDTIVSVLRGVRQTGLGFFRRTLTVTRLRRRFKLARRRVNGGLNGDRSTLSGGLHLLQLPTSIQCCVRGRKLARHRTQTLLGISSPRIV